MKISYIVYNSHICNRVENKLRKDTSKTIKFKISLEFPISYKLYVDGKQSEYSFTNETVKSLIKHSEKFFGDKYYFVIQSIYLNCLNELINLERGN